MEKKKKTSQSRVRIMFGVFNVYVGVVSCSMEMGHNPSFVPFAQKKVCQSESFRGLARGAC